MSRRLGFTGTRHGMTAAQRNAVAKILGRGWQECHHGDCVGADAEAHALAVAAGIEPVIHPPTDSRHRAFCDAQRVLAALPYLERNRAIVDDTDELVAAPATAVEEQRSGTWSTIRYASKLGRTVTVVYPDGSTTRVVVASG